MAAGFYLESSYWPSLFLFLSASPVSPWLLKRVTPERGRIKLCICIYQKACVMKCSDSLVHLCSVCCKEWLKANITHTHNQLTNTHTHTQAWFSQEGLWQQQADLDERRSFVWTDFRSGMIKQPTAAMFITSTLTSFTTAYNSILA